MSSTPWAAGQCPISGYTLNRCLGKGAFGEVWEATGAGGVLTALKRVELDQNARCGEAELAALDLLKNVRHPHLLSIHGSWITGNILVIGCELADESLAHRFRKAVQQEANALSVDEILRYLTDAAEALDYLGRPIHRVNDRSVRIQHCDVKPANLLLQGGSVKVADFGLAKSLERVLVDRTTSGTPAYSPPEFFRGSVAASSDQYSLAVTYYQLRTGRLPFSGRFAEVMEGHLHQPPNLDGLSDTERLIVTRALAKDPALRWDSCTKFIGELERGLSDVAQLNSIKKTPDTTFEANQPTVRFRGQSVTSGMLLVEGELVQVPLQRTEVQVRVVGAMADVYLTQVFVNSHDRAIEAIYVFPLPDDAAFHRMRMIVNDRTIESEVRQMEEARAVFNEAKRAGHGVAMVEQATPNIVTSRVANILPGQEIRIEIAYLQSLRFDDGQYRMVVPLVVSPRYVQGSNPASEPMVTAEKEVIKSPRLPSGLLRGDFVRIEIELDSGVPLCGFDSPSHDIETIAEEGVNRVQLRLRRCDEIPNRDFVLNYRVRGQRIEHTMVCEPGHNGQPGTFLLITTPPASQITKQPARQITIIMDCSASMSGAPPESVKKVALQILDGLDSCDTFNIVAFNDRTSPLAANVLPATTEQLNRARAFIQQLKAAGGAEMLEPLRLALQQGNYVPVRSESSIQKIIQIFARRPMYDDRGQPTRILIVLTGGSISGEYELISAIRPIIGNNRIVAFGIGTSVNRHFIYMLAAAGRGFAEFLHPEESTLTTIDRTLRRLGRPVLTKIELAYDEQVVSELIPAPVPDLYSELPLEIVGRFRGNSPPRIRLRARLEHKAYEQEIIPEQTGRKVVGGSLSALWARRQIEVLMDQMWEHPEQASALRRRIVELAVQYHIASPLTSFVAVEHRTKTQLDQEAQAVPILVPQYMPQGMVEADLDVSSDPIGDTLHYSRAAKTGGKNWRGSGSSKSTSIHSKLRRVKKPRVHITYEAEIGGAHLTSTLPFVIGVLGDFSGHRSWPITSMTDLNFISIDRDNFDEVMRHLLPELRLSVANSIGGGNELSVQLRFRSMEDFWPVAIIKQVEPLRKLFEKRLKLGELLTIIRNALETQSKLSATVTTDRVLTLMNELFPSETHWDNEFADELLKVIESTDLLLSTQLATIMHAPEFQKLEGSWRGLCYLVMNSETGSQLKLQLLNISKQELLHVLSTESDVKASYIFKMPNGTPFTAIIGDYEFTGQPSDIELLTKLSQHSAKAFCPFISSASPKILGLEDWLELFKADDIHEICNSVENEAWNFFRESDESRFIVLTMPRALARTPYGRATKPIDEFGFEEIAFPEEGTPTPIEPSNHCWMNTAYVFGARLTDAFARFGWCTAIFGKEDGGKVENLPAHVCFDDNNSLNLKCPTDVAISERRLKPICNAGFLPLCHENNSDFAVFHTAQTTQRVKPGGDDDATRIAYINSQLPNVLATSRIAHYVTMIIREKIAVMALEDLELYLNNWVMNYVLETPNSTAEERAIRPFRSARIEVKGRSEVVICLQPQPRNDESTAESQVVIRSPLLP